MRRRVRYRRRDFQLLGNPLHKRDTRHPPNGKLDLGVLPCRHYRYAARCRGVSVNNPDHSFTDTNGARWTACSECNRGGNGNDKDKCACGWQVTEWNGLGCFLGIAIIGDIAARKPLTRGQKRYRRYLISGDSFKSFIDFCRWDQGYNYER